jgi:katanin p80 WD40 repeat-containing subunit B1
MRRTRTANARHKVRDLVAHQGDVNCVRIGPVSGQVLASGGQDCMINLWRVDRPASLFSFDNGSSAPRTLCFDPSEGAIASGTQVHMFKTFLPL